VLEGKFYLFACPFFFTFVGQYVRHLNFQEIVLANAGYFTRTGATFDVLCSKGLVTGSNGSQFHPCAVTLVLPDGTEIPNGVLIPAQGPKFPWEAKTPWVKK
jgi:hypothetical protein